VSTNYFKSLLFLQFSVIFTELGTCSVCQYAENWNNFQNFAFKISGEFFKTLNQQ